MVVAVMGVFRKWFGPSSEELIITKVLDTLQNQHAAQQRLVESVIHTASEYVELLKRQHELLTSPINRSEPRLMTPEQEARYEQHRKKQAKTKDAIVVDLDEFLDDFQRDSRFFTPE
jgi:hypothetical protein